MPMALCHAVLGRETCPGILFPAALHGVPGQSHALGMLKTQDLSVTREISVCPALPHNLGSKKALVMREHALPIQ